MKVSADPNTPDCYNCHPGPRTRCLRGGMSRAGLNCKDCHGDMSGKIYCEACHNSPHAEYTSSNAADNIIPQQLQGDSYWIWNCYVCHTDYMPPPQVHF